MPHAWCPPVNNHFTAEKPLNEHNQTAPGSLRLCGEKSFYVITSYSIHYTKLYYVHVRSERGHTIELELENCLRVLTRRVAGRGAGADGAVARHVV